jgi:sugar lactone lactonase YvrE
MPLKQLLRRNLAGIASAAAFALLFPGGMAAQSAQFGSAANFGAIPLGQTSSPITLTATFSGSTGVTVQSIAVLTQGAPGLDFALAGGGTCAVAQTYKAGATCTVAVTFAPRYAAARYGAVVLEDGSGNALATGYLQGVGSGPQAGFQPRTADVRNYPNVGNEPLRAMAIDAAGDIFVGSTVSGKYQTVVDEIPSGCVVASCVKTLPGSYGAAWGLAVDGAGNLFIADISAPGQITEIPAAGGYSTMKTLTGSFGAATSLAVDGSGNLYITDTTNSAVTELPAAGGYSTSIKLATGYNQPTGVAVDASSDVFFAAAAQLYEIAAVDGKIPASPTITRLGSGFLDPIYLAADVSGNLFVTDSNVNHVGLFELVAEGGYTKVVSLAPGAFLAPSGLALDAAGNLYVVDNQDFEGIEFGDYIDIVPRGFSGGISFPTVTVPLTIDNADGARPVYFANLGNKPLTLGNLNISNGNFDIDLSATTCTSALVLAPGADCVAYAYFSPVASGANLTANLVFSSNSNNEINSILQVPLSGIGLFTPTVTVKPSQSNVAVSQPLTVQITVSGGKGSPALTGSVILQGGGYSSPSATLTGGTATIAIPANSLTTGTETLAASYTPDSAASSSYNTSTGLASVTVTTGAMIQPVIAVTPLGPNIAVSQPLMETVTVNGGTGNPLPTGSVTLSSGSYVSPAVALSGGSATVTIPSDTLPIGTDAIIAAYTPDAASSAKYLDASFGFWATVTDAAPPTGSSSVAFGTVPIGQSSAAMPVSFTFQQSATIGSVVALTQGAAGLDFALVSGGTCTDGASFSAGQTCTAKVTFTPQFAGQRNGGVVILDSDGKPLALSYVHGTGTGAQMIFLSEPYYNLDYVSADNALVSNYPTTTTEIDTGLNYPAVAVDGAGDVFIADLANYAVEEIPAGCTAAACTQTLVGDLNGPSAIALDGAGNLFITIFGDGTVNEIPQGCLSASCVVTLASGFNGPYGLSVDAGGNVFVADTNNNAIKEIVAQGGYTKVLTLNDTLDLPWSVVTDAQGNLFVAQGGNQCQVFIPGTCTTINTSVVELQAADNYSKVTTLASGIFGKPFGLAIDGSGNVYEGDYGDPCSIEFLQSAAYVSTIRLCKGSAGDAFIFPENVAVQANGNLYLPDDLHGTVYRLDYVDPPSLNFSTPAELGQVDSVDGTLYFAVQNNGNAPLTFKAFTLSDPSFQIDTAHSSCTTAKPIQPGYSCFLGVFFEPVTTGLQNATLTLIDNNLNGTSGKQVIALTADALPPAPVILSNPSNPTTAVSATFTFSDTQNGVTFVCSIDLLPFSACSSGIVYPALSGGAHSFQVKAQDNLGHLSEAAIYNWTVNEILVPVPLITSGPGHVTNAVTAAFDFTDTQSGVTFQCSLDGVAFTPCTSGISYSKLVPTLAPGLYYSVYHTFAVEAQDSKGDTSQAAFYPWNINNDTISAVPVDFGTVAVGQNSAPQTVNFTFSPFDLSATIFVNGKDTIAKIDAATLGVTGLDFAVTDPGTCAVGTVVTKTSTCSLTATFTPSYAGLRKGGIILLDAAGNGIGTAYIEGTGTAPQVTFTPYSTVSYTILPPQNNSDPGKDLYAPITDATVDGAGNVYVTDAVIGSVDGTIAVSAGDIWKFPAGCNSAACIVQIATTTSGKGLPDPGLDLPTGIAIDGAGTLWGDNAEPIPPYSLSTLGKWTSYECPEPVTDYTTLGDLRRPAVDGVGQVSQVGYGILFLCGTQLGTVSTPAVSRKARPSAQAVEQAAKPATGQATGTAAKQSSPRPNAGGNEGSFDFSTSTPSIAVDPQGNIFVADAGNNAIKEVLASSAYTISKVVGSGFKNPTGVASDAFGNIFVADTGNNAIKEIVAAGGYTTVLTITPYTLTADDLGNNITVDAQGNLYIVSQASFAANQLEKLDFADAPSLNFATPTKIGLKDTTDGTLTATVENSGNAPLTISALALSNTNFQIDPSATTCAPGSTLAVGVSCTIGVFFAPQETGSISATLTLTDNALNATAATQKFALTGVGFLTPTAQTPNVVATPSAKSITTAQTVSVQVTVSGKKGSPVPTGAISLTSGSYASAAATLVAGAVTIQIPSGDLALGANPLSVVYTPDAASSTTYTPAAGSASVTVTAASKATPTVSVTPIPVTPTIAQDLAVTVAVTGPMGSPLPTGSITLLSGSFSSGSVVLSNGSATVPIPARTLPAGTDTLTANYAPDFASASNYTNATGSGTVTVQPVVKTTPAVAVTPASPAIAANQSVLVTVSLSGGLGNPAPTGTVTLTSGSYASAPAALSAGAVSISVPAGALATARDTLTAAYTPDSVSAPTYTAASGTGVVSVTAASSSTSLQASSGTITLGETVTFTATVTGTASGATPTGSVTFLDGATSLGNRALNASGVATLATSSLALGTHSVTAAYGGDSNYGSSTSPSVTVVVQAPAVPGASLTPASLSFTSPSGTVSAAQVATLTNTGNAPLTIAGIAITGANASAFAETGTCGTSLAAGASCTISVTFSPSSQATFTATLTVTDNAPAQPMRPAPGAAPRPNALAAEADSTQTVALSGTGTAPLAPVASLTPSSLTFTAQAGATSAAQTATLQNTGNAPLSIAAISIAGANPTDFSQTNTCGSSLAPGKSCAISVTFTPASAASFTASLSVADNASGSPQTVSLSGTGTVPPAPVAVLSPASLVFPSQVAGSSSAAMTATLTNGGNAPLALGGITVTGANAAAFTETSNCPASVVPAASCTISVVFTPSAAGSFTASLAVADNASGSPQTVSLTGTGAAAPDFTIAATPASQSVAVGAAASYTISVSAINGIFPGSVALSVSGLPAGATAAFTPASVSPGSSSASSTLAVQTSGQTSSLARPAHHGSPWPLAASVLGLLLLPLRRKWRSRIVPAILLAFVAIGSLGAVAALTGCGGGFALGRSAQTYTLTITGTSGADTHSTTVELTVQ